MKVLITGGSGMLGSAITKKLISENISVVHLTRNKSSKHDIKNYEWDWEKNKIDNTCFEGVTDIIHLAGAGIAEKPWTTKRKKEIVKSRVLTARLIFERLKELNHTLNSFISASGVGYYGAITNNKTYKETDSSHPDFISDCCVQWENAVDQFSEITRTTKMRLGIILDKNDGAVAKIAGIIKKNIGAPIGSGKQFMPWIHLDDAVGLFLHALKNKSISGTYNAVASEHTNNKFFTETLAEKLNKKLRLPNVPSFILKLIYGELADILLEGVKVDNEKIITSGYSFKHNKLSEALEDIYR
jgi:uncharacterized protein